MTSSEQTPPISGQAPPDPEKTSPTPDQIPSDFEQAPPTSDTSPNVDITYQLLVQQIDGARPTQCRNPNDHIRVRTNFSGNLNPAFFKVNEVVCRAYCDWSGYRGDGSVIYIRRDDMLAMSGLDELYLHTGHGIYGTVVETSIMGYSLGTRSPGGKVATHEGRYVKLIVKFAAAAGSPARSANVWGKKVVSNEALGAVSLSEEEILEYAKNPWTSQPDD
ncbi:hypothetical protein BDR22DRAFT_892056 [Usnea florida]